MGSMLARTMWNVLRFIPFFFLIGCGSVTQSPSRPTLIATPTAEHAATQSSTAILNPNSSATTTSSPQPTQFNTPPAPQPNPGVSVTTDKGSFQTGEAIVVTIRNDLSVPIYGLTGKTYCTILLAQRKEGDEWQDQSPCTAGAPPAWEPILARAQFVVALSPQLPTDQPLPPGEYRILFLHRIGAISGTEATGYSNPFTIVQANP